MKRTYTRVSIRPSDAGHVIWLDEKALMSPAGRPMETPSAALAEAVAEEWRAQRREIDRQRLSLTSMLATQLDRVTPLRREVIDQIMRFAETDHAAYRVVEPAELAARQAAALDPLLAWLDQRLGVTLAVLTSVMPAGRNEAALAALRATVEGFDPARLTAIAVATPAVGSLVIALALVEGRLSADEAFAVSQIDEAFQAERWGVDAESRAARAALAADVALAARFLALATA